MKKKIFTLIELIVVIAIVIVLAAATIMILSSYIVKARDTRRSADLRVMKTGLETALITNAKLPIPDGPVILTGGGSLLGYQGNFGSSVSKTVNMTKEPKDPADDNYYTYRVDADLKNYQIMAMNESSLSDSDYNQNRINAINYSSRFPNLEGKAMGIILKSNNEPIQLSMTSLNLYSTNQKLKIYISSAGTGSYFEGTGIALQSITQFTANGYDAPAGCPEGFIPVPGSKEFNQAGFCVAKYEMSYKGLTGNNGGWNTYNYNASLVPVSAIGNSPITNLKQGEAITACNKMGPKYHLITNKEWMTIARNIESQSVNWSSGKVDSGYIYNGVSDDLTKGCDGNSGNSPITTNYATTTGGPDNNALGSTRSTCIDKRQLKLSNRQIIWDIAGNVREHVNKMNTINGSGYADRTNGIGFPLSKDNNDMCSDANGYYEWNLCKADARKLYGPSNSSYNRSNGVGGVYDFDGTIFLRGGDASREDYAGIFLILLSWTSTNTDITTGFRCSY